jgi:Holliday junction DNA helicase RuvA
MLAYIKGVVKTLAHDHGIIVTNDGVGYLLYWHSKTAANLSIGETTEIYIHHHVAENNSDLYGFIDSPSLELFKSLISISGIGPKTALAICAVTEISDVISAIVNNQPNLLTGLPGVGQKTAERIVLEMKSKIKNLALNNPGFAEKIVGLRSDDVEVIDALIGLGYNRQEINAAIKQIDPGINDLGQRIKAVLKLLA